MWAAVFIGFFSLSQSKLPGYVLPALPPLCLLAAAVLEELWPQKPPLAWAQSGLVGIIFLICGRAPWAAREPEIPHAALFAHGFNRSGRRRAVVTQEPLN
ncbi:MAG TPA: hypothetical protein VF627_01645 [Abditibacterium sp.]|jgi:4-amino-4-deoxy-L-arabinose transferase-like glycosyltransferase